MLIGALIFSRPESAGPEKVLPSAIENDDVVVVTATLPRFRIVFRRLLLRHFSVRFHMRMLWGRILTRWWRFRGY
jgi:hypothetical protein